MPSTSTARWIALLVAFAAVVSGISIAYAATDPTLRSVGVGVFIVGAVGYFAARIHMILKGRR